MKKVIIHDNVSGYFFSPKVKSDDYMANIDRIRIVALYVYIAKT